MFSDNCILKEAVISTSKSKWKTVTDELTWILQEEITKQINEEILKRLEEIQMTIPKERMERLFKERCSVQKEF